MDYKKERLKMKKKIIASLMSALVGVFALDLRAEVAWATGSCAPSDWQPLDGNILYNVTGTSAGIGATGYDSSDLAVLTNGSVPMSDSENKAGIFGFRNGDNISWTFAAPKTLEQIRICTCYLSDTSYDGVHIAKVEVIYFGESSWVQIAGESQYNGESTAGKINYTLLSNGDDPVAQNIIGLRITFGACETGFANYYTEIEAVGFNGTTGPVLGSFALVPMKTKAGLSGTIVDVGTDATACDIYLSLDNAESVKIAEGVTGSFEYQIQGLTAGTTYAYELSVSNNAATAKGTVQGGSFTTLAADAQTASWTQGEYAPAGWTALGNNILRNLDAAEKSGVSFAASQDMTKLTDGTVPSPAAGAETVGFQPNGTIAWSFENPMTIEKIRISSLWESTLYNGISINAVQVKFPNSTGWETLDVPTVQWTGGTQLGQTETLADDETGYLATNVVALKITFGTQKAAIANYYAEIEAVGRATSDGPGPSKKRGMMMLFF